MAHSYEKRDQRVNVRLTKSERDAAVVAAESEGVTVAEWLRFMVRRRVGMPAPGDAQ